MQFFQARSKPAPSPFRCVSIAILLAFLSTFAHAKSLPVEVTGIKMEITNLPPAWTFTGWEAETIDKVIHIYVFYAGDLYDAQNAPITFSLNLLFTAKDDYKIIKVGETNYVKPGVATHTQNAFQVSAASSPSINFTLFDGEEHEPDGVVHFLPVNLEIYNAQAAANAVPEKDEETLGAFTVANLNDTDGDGIIDNGDNTVKQAATGEDEEDLMKLIVKGPNIGRMKVTVVSGVVEFWEKSTKETPITKQGNAIFIDGADLPKTIWVEATNHSNALRDIELKLGFEAPGGQLTNDLDKVKATAVWSKKVQFFNMGNKHPADLDEQVLIDNVQLGLGLEELSGLANGQGQRLWGVEATMLAQFKVLPDDIGDEGSVKFDITRQKERRSFFVIDGNTVGPPEASFPVKKDLSNDDNIGLADEDNEPKNNHIFSLDAPKALLIEAQGQAAPPDGTSFTYSGNFNEFVRVSFNGNRPEGNNLSGSRCSNKLVWNTQQVGIKQNGTVVRNGQKNWIREGHEQLIARP